MVAALFGMPSAFEARTLQRKAGCMGNGAVAPGWRVRARCGVRCVKCGGGGGQRVTNGGMVAMGPFCLPPYAVLNYCAFCLPILSGTGIDNDYGKMETEINRAWMKPSSGILNEVHMHTPLSMSQPFR